MKPERIAVTTVDLPVGSIISIDARLYPAVVWGGSEGVIVKQGDQYILELPELVDKCPECKGTGRLKKE